MSENKVFMAFGQGKEVTGEGGNFKKYIGVGAFKVVAVNPDKSELEAIYGTTLDKEPEYTSKAEDGTDKVRLDFVVATNPEKNNNIDFKTKVSFFLEKKARTNSTGTKVQVINAYGETTWVDLEMAKTGDLPANMSWYEKPYRVAMVGEDDLTSFLKKFLGIPNKSYRDKNGVTHEIENKSDAEARLEKLVDYFKGNVKELKEIIKFQPDNLIKIPVGIKTTDDGKEYQAIYTKMFLSPGVKDYTKLKEDIQASQAAGAYKNTTFESCDLKEYVVAPTNFTEPSMGQESLPGWFGQQ